MHRVFTGVCKSSVGEKEGKTGLTTFNYTVGFNTSQAYVLNSLDYIVTGRQTNRNINEEALQQNLQQKQSQLTKS